MSDVDEWRKTEQEKHRLCACGCGKEIKILTSHKYGRGIPLYYKKHKSPMNDHKTVHEWVRYNTGKHLCHCGCGGLIKIMQRHHKPSVGIPQYIFRHAPNSENIKIFICSENGKYECACGCGGMIVVNKQHFSKGVPRYLHGHCPLSEVSKNKISKSNYGRSPSDESRRRMSKSQKGNINSKGKPKSDETRSKLSNAHTGKKLSEDHKQKISASSPRLSGDQHPNWQGGISYSPYCEKFNDELKDRVRDEFDRKCISCDKTEAENGTKLSIHHVTYTKMEGCNGQQFKLVPLCKSCHSKTGHNREHWEAHYMAILETRGLLNWS